MNTMVLHETVVWVWSLIHKISKVIHTHIHCIVVIYILLRRMQFRWAFCCVHLLISQISLLILSSSLGFPVFSPSIFFSMFPTSALSAITFCSHALVDLVEFRHQHAHNLLEFFFGVLEVSLQFYLALVHISLQLFFALLDVFLALVHAFF